MHKTPLWLWLMLWWLPSAANGQAAFTLTADQLQNGQAVELDKLGWKYSPHDEPQFAEPQFDDRAWVTLQDTTKPQASSWQGIGWFRLHLRVAIDLADTPLNLELSHLGASEIYLNGTLLRRFGMVGKTPGEETAFNPNALPLAVSFHAGSEQVIAVRYSNQQTADVNAFLAKWVVERRNNFGGVGFRGRIKSFGSSSNHGYTGSGGFSYDLFQGAVALTFGLLHLLLYVFFARQRDNLFYSLFLLQIALNGFCLALFRTVHWGLTEFYFLHVTHWTTILAFVALLAFLYATFEASIPRRIWVLVALGCLDIGVFASPAMALYSSLITSLDLLVVTAESLRVIGSAIWRRQRGAWIIGIGVLCLAVVTLRDTFSSIVTIPSDWYFVFDIIGYYGLMLAISIHLAREFAQTNAHLADQLVQVKQLSARELEHQRTEAELTLQHEQERARRALLEVEHDRKAKELEEARQLQLSMLPKKLPNLPHLDLAAHMQTASEVGGDYYDFHLGDDGTLTVAVGDATGHGLKAGTMVAAVKSLFVTLAYHPDLPHIFTRMSQTLKQMQMRGVFMALALVKCDERRVNVAIAGMPPLLVYRQATNTVERINLTGLPLGSVTNYRYREMTTEMEPGDVLLLLSDGLTELFNPADEMFGEERVEQCLQACAQCAPDEIIAQLLAAAEAWSEGRKLEDDLTLVALKAK